MEPIDQCLDSSVAALNMHLDGAVACVADPAADPKFAGLIASPSAEEDSLNLPSHSDATGDLHHTVAMSGASSAFMPTTL